jgi:hypothetical protein
MVLRYNFLSFSWPHVSSGKKLLSFCLPFTNDLLDCGMALHHNIPSFWLVTQVPAINYNFSILYRINYWVVAWSFATLSYVLASYTSMSKTSQPITSSISKNLKVLLVKFRTKKELTACLVASSAIYIEQVHWLRMQWPIAITIKRRLLSGFHVHTSAWNGWKQSLIRRNKVTHSYYCVIFKFHIHLNFSLSRIFTASRIHSTRRGTFVRWIFVLKIHFG